MNKKDIIDYLNRIKTYLNLSALCKKYNEMYSDNTIDYNNLRTVLKGNVPNRLSTDKLVAFYDFLIKDILQNEFLLESSNVKEDTIKQIIDEHSSKITAEVLEAIRHGV